MERDGTVPFERHIAKRTAVSFDVYRYSLDCSGLDGMQYYPYDIVTIPPMQVLDTRYWKPPGRGESYCRALFRYPYLYTLGRPAVIVSCVTFSVASARLSLALRHRMRWHWTLWTAYIHEGETFSISANHLIVLQYGRFSSMSFRFRGFENGRRGGVVVSLDGTDLSEIAYEDLAKAFLREDEWEIERRLTRQGGVVLPAANAPSDLFLSRGRKLDRG